MRVKELEPRDAVTVVGSDSLRDAAKHLSEDDIGVLVVMDSHGPVGVIGERDIVRAIADDADISSTQVVAYMTEAPLSLTDDSALGEAIRLMNEWGFRHLVVRTDQGEVSGVISMRDVVALLGTNWPEL